MWTLLFSRLGDVGVCTIQTFTRVACSIAWVVVVPAPGFVHSIRQFSFDFYDVRSGTEINYLI